MIRIFRPCAGISTVLPNAPRSRTSVTKRKDYLGSTARHTELVGESIFGTPRVGIAAQNIICRPKVCYLVPAGVLKSIGDDLLCATTLSLLGGGGFCEKCSVLLQLHRWRQEPTSGRHSGRERRLAPVVPAAHGASLPHPRLAVIFTASLAGKLAGKQPAQDVEHKGWLCGQSACGRG